MENIHGKVKLKDNVVIRRIDNISGKILEEKTYHNLIVTTGLERIADLIAKLSTTGYDQIAIGTGAVAPVIGDTSLGIEQKRSVATVTQPTTTQIQYFKLFTFLSGESFNITEAGIFDLPVAGNMLNRFTFPAKAVDINTDLSVTITITVS